MRYDYMMCEKCGWTRGITVEGNYESGYYPTCFIKSLYYTAARGSAKTGMSLLEGMEQEG
jgi:hypothetical protein